MKAVKFLKFAVFATAFVALFGFIVMTLWNWLIPCLFTGANPITFFQAIGILVLAKILFGFGRGWGGGGHWKNKAMWKSRFQQHVSNMSPEDRAKFKAKWGEKCWGKFAEGEETDSKTEAAT